ncbi:MAG TPA: hypothetical protein VF407_07330 [Polyangiaceae bacterium]
MSQTQHAPDLALRLAREEEVDDELLALPAPPKKERTYTVALLAVTIVASLAMAFSLLGDAKYAFGSDQATDLADLHAAQIDPALGNHYVTAEGMLGAAGAIRYERAFDSDSYRVAPVAGRSDVWVEIRVPDGQESSRFVPPTQFSGRLVRFDEVGPRHRGLRDAITNIGGAAVPANAYLVVDGAAPATSRWAVTLVLLFVGFAAWNAFAIQRLLRKVA